MKPSLLVLLGLHAAAPAFAQHDDHGASPTAEEQQAEDAHSGHGDSAPVESAEDAHVAHEAEPALQPAPAGEESPPPAALSGPVHAADTIFDSEEMAEARKVLADEGGASRSSLLLADRIESRMHEGDDTYAWDVQGWHGGDINKLWLKSEGFGAFGDNPEDIELQALYSRAITPFFDLQAGVRHDFRPEPERSHLVLGVEGLLPYVFELDAAAFVSEDGDFSGRIEAEYDVRVTQRLVLQPRVEVDFAGEDVPELGIGSGVGSVEAGFRLRYELRREIAPYVGIALDRKRGTTADIARAAGEDPSRWELVLGVRAWF